MFAIQFGHLTVAYIIRTELSLQHFKVLYKAHNKLCIRILFAYYKVQSALFVTVHCTKLSHIRQTANRNAMEIISQV